jgi:Molecular chaperone GrpE (heat shock protein)
LSEKKEDTLAKMEEAKDNIEKEAVQDEVEEVARDKEDNVESGEATTEESTEEATPDKEAKAQEKKLFKKNKKKDKKDEKIQELTEKLTRQMAEFDNFRKRSEKEKASRYEMGAKDVIEKMLPVIDNFERGLQGVAPEQKEDPFVEGMDMIYKQFMASLEEIGVKPIEAVGQTFDPDRHNAVMHEESDEHEENTISEELQKGYIYRDHVVRYSMVKVVN